MKIIFSNKRIEKLNIEGEKLTNKALVKSWFDHPGIPCHETGARKYKKLEH
jgi:hypothetical protein